MLSMRQLNKAIDSLETAQDKQKERSKTDLQVYLTFMKYLDSGWKKPALAGNPPKKFTDLIPDSARNTVLEQSLSYANSIKATLQSAGVDSEHRSEEHTS